MSMLRRCLLAFARFRASFGGPRSALCGLFAFALLCAPAAQAEREPHIAPADLVEPALLTGPGYRVALEAEIRGLQARFRIDTQWGTLHADSVEMLELRIAEMPAVEALYSQGVTDALREAGIDAVTGPARTIADLARHPVQAAKNLPAGVLRYLRERLQKYGDRARKLGDRIDRVVFHDGSPYDATGPMDDDRGPKPHEPWWDKPVDEFSRLLRSEAGHAKARRQIAQALGIDPGTSNPLLRERLDAIAWAVAGQRLGIDYALKLASAGAVTALGYIETTHRVTLTTPPDDLRRMAEQRMERWTADPDLRYRLAWRSGFSPLLLTALLDRLDALEPADGAEGLLEIAMMAGSEIEARFVLNAVRQIQHGLGATAHRGRFETLAALPGYVGTDGEFVLPLPVDRLSWTEDVRLWFDHAKIAGHARRTVLIAGAISPRAERALTRRGWSIVSFQPYPGAPPYRRAMLGMR